MSTENKLTYLEETKEQIKQSIIGKGVTVNDTDTFRSYAEKINSIQSGGGECPTHVLDLSDGVGNVFKVASEINNVIFPSSLQNVNNISSCFANCSKLESITLPDLPNVFDMNSCFSRCSSLTSITLPSSLPKVSSIYGCFKYCGNLTSITLPELPLVTNMSNCFNNCHSLTSITLPSSLPNVSGIYGCFADCYALTSITLPELPKVTDMGSYSSNDGCFANCSKLESITLPDLPNVTKISYCFWYCTSLQHLQIGNINPNISRLIDWSIDTCNSLTVDSLVNIMNALPTISNTRVCTIGTTNMSKLSPEQLAIATSKGWSIN